MDSKDFGPDIAKPGGRSIVQALQGLDEAIDRVTSIYTPEVVQLLRRFSAESGRSPAEVLLSALGLYKIALDAHKEGHGLAVVDNSWDVIQEISVLGPMAQPNGPGGEPEPAHAAG